MTLRLAQLYLRSRLAGWVVAALAGIGALTWWGLDRSDAFELTLLLLIVMPVAAATAIGVSARSPFGETERTASRSLPAPRLGHLGGLLLIAALALIAANQAESGAATDHAFAWVLVRNGAGYAGLALLGARFLGAGLSWVPPTAYGMAAYVVGIAREDKSAWWLWPVQDDTDGSSWVIALGLLGVGLLVVLLQGARETPGEAE